MATLPFLGPVNRHRQPLTGSRLIIVASAIPLAMLFAGGIGTLNAGHANPEVVRAAARAVKAACEEVGLAPFIQTSGSRGYHVVMPLQPGPDVEVVRDFAAELALLVAARDPDRLSVEWRKAKRDGRLLLDTARNGYAQTLVAPYSVRPKPEAPVATPMGPVVLRGVEARTWLAEHDDDAVLDVAAGYGEPGLTAARAAGPGGRVVCTDLSGPMLAVGRAAQAVVEEFLRGV